MAERQRISDSEQDSQGNQPRKKEELGSRRILRNLRNQHFVDALLD